MESSVVLPARRGMCMQDGPLLPIHSAALHLQTTVREKEKQKSQYFMFKWFYARFSIHDMTKPYYPPLNQQSFYLCCMFCLLLSPPCVVPEENLIRFMVFSYSTTNCNENIINKIFPFTADLYWFIINRSWWLFWAVSWRKLEKAEVLPDNFFLPTSFWIRSNCSLSASVSLHGRKFWMWKVKKYKTKRTIFFSLWFFFLENL